MLQFLEQIEITMLFFCKKNRHLARSCIYVRKWLDGPDRMDIPQYLPAMGIRPTTHNNLTVCNYLLS